MRARYFVSVSDLRVFFTVSRTLALLARRGAGTARRIARLTFSFPRCALNSFLPALLSVILNTLLVPEEIEYDAVRGRRVTGVAVTSRARPNPNSLAGTEADRVTDVRAVDGARDRVRQHVIKTRVEHVRGRLKTRRAPLEDVAPDRVL